MVRESSQSTLIGVEVCTGILPSQRDTQSISSRLGILFISLVEVTTTEQKQSIRMLFLQVVELLHHRGFFWRHGNFLGFRLLESVDVHGKLIIVTIIRSGLIAVFLREVLRAIVAVTILELDGKSCLGTIRLQTNKLSTEILYLLTDRIFCKQGVLFH